MPRLNGFEATRAIRLNEEQGRHTPIIAMTANSMRGDRDRCIEAGMDDYVGKPLRPKALEATVTRALASRRPLRGAATHCEADAVTDRQDAR